MSEFPPPDIFRSSRKSASEAHTRSALMSIRRKRTRRYQHGSLNESPDGKRWIVKYYYAPGKQTTKTLGRKKDITRKQAEEMREALVKPLNHNPLRNLGQETFEHFVEEVFFPMKVDTDWRENTAKECMREIRKH